MSPLRDVLARYEAPDARRGVRQLAETGLLFGGAWYVAYRGLEVSYGITLALALPAAGLLIRLFIIQHDCGHGSFLPSQRANDFIGAVLGVVTLTPYRYWRRFHARHHTTSGQLERRGDYDVKTLTAREYVALSWWGRLAYRAYRHPIVLFGLAPALLFFVVHRYPGLAPAAWRVERRSIHWTNLGIGAVLLAMGRTIGLERFFLVHVPIAVIAASVGMWLFYVQHQFEDGYWAPAAKWDFEAAGLAGSSCYQLPAVLGWFTGDIGLHHIHHLDTRIPNYRLRSCFDENPPLQRVTRLTLRESLRCARLKLWDEGRGKLVGFGDLA